LSNSVLFNQTQKLIPKCLADIVRKNHHQLHLAFVQFDEVHSLSKPLSNSNIKGHFAEAFLYKRVISQTNDEPICAVGYLQTSSGKIAYHTSRVVGVDGDSRLILTSTGSHYIIEKFIDVNQIDTTLLLHICAVSHLDGWGSHFGVPHIFY